MSNRYMRVALLLIRLYPRAWRERYQEEMAEVLKQHSVRFVTLFDIMVGALDAHMHADLQPERIYSMAHTLRVSAIAVFCAFLLFALAYIALQQIVDPRALFNAVASSHPDLQVSFSTIVVSAEIAFLAVVAGGLIILCVALAKAIKAGRRDVLARFGSAILLVILFVAASLIFQGFLNGNAGFSGIYILIFLAVLIAATVLIAQGILRTEFSVKLLRFMIIPMAITGLAMGVSCIAALTWLLRLWADAPQFATSQSMGPGLAGGLGGSTGFAINVVVMALTTMLAIAALVRGLRTNRATLT
ncbi:MAG: hypothetical protein ACYDER_23725 [Ktedonobacteraceae bacterium]